MVEVEKSLLVPYPAQDMFDLVDAVEYYPAFLPWCCGVDVIERNDRLTTATVHMQYRGIRQSFTTTNSKETPALISIALVAGPFRTLQGYWRFTPLQQHACKVVFYLQYNFSNLILEKAMAPVFEQITQTLVDHFARRADALHAA